MFFIQRDRDSDKKNKKKIYIFFLRSVIPFPVTSLSTVKFLTNSQPPLKNKKNNNNNTRLDRKWIPVLVKEPISDSLCRNALLCKLGYTSRIFFTMSKPGVQADSSNPSAKSRTCPRFLVMTRTVRVNRKFSVLYRLRSAHIGAKISNRSDMPDVILFDRS